MVSAGSDANACVLKHVQENRPLSSVAEVLLHKVIGLGSGPATDLQWRL